MLFIEFAGLSALQISTLSTLVYAGCSQIGLICVKNSAKNLGHPFFSYRSNLYIWSEPAFDWTLLIRKHMVNLQQYLAAVSHYGKPLPNFNYITYHTVPPPGPYPPK